MRAFQYGVETQRNNLLLSLHVCRHESALYRPCQVVKSRRCAVTEAFLLPAHRWTKVRRNFDRFTRRIEQEGEKNNNNNKIITEYWRNYVVLSFEFANESLACGHPNDTF